MSELAHVPDRTLLDRAESIQRSAKQLYRLVKLEAPPLIIESARHVLAKRIISFPVDAEALAAQERIKQTLENQQQQFMLKHGFYDDVLADEG